MPQFQLERNILSSMQHWKNWIDAFSTLQRRQASLPYFPNGQMRTNVPVHGPLNFWAAGCYFSVVFLRNVSYLANVAIVESVSSIYFSTWRISQLQVVAPFSWDDSRLQHANTSPLCSTLLPECYVRLIEIWGASSETAAPCVRTADKSPIVLFAAPTKEAQPAANKPIHSKWTICYW